MSDPWDSISGHGGPVENPGIIDVEGVQYTTDEAEKLVAWLEQPPYELLDKFFSHIRQTSVDMMDEGMISMDSAQELVRQSAMRFIIKQVRGMAESVRAKLKAAKEADTAEI